MFHVVRHNVKRNVKKTKKQPVYSLFWFESTVCVSRVQHAQVCVKLKTIVSQMVNRKKRKTKIQIEKSIDAAGVVIQSKVHTMYVGSSVENFTCT